MASKNSASYDFIVGKTYTWKVRSSFSDIAYDATEGWGDWSTRTFTVTSDDAVTAPAAPTLVSPDDAVNISLDEIYSNAGSSYLMYDPADNDVQLNHIQVTGEFDRGDGTGENKSINKVSELSTIALENFVPRDEGYTYIVGETYTWRVRSSFNEGANAGSNAGWGVWSVTRQFTVTAGSTVPVAPTLISPKNNGKVVYSTIHDHSAELVYTPALGVENNHLMVKGVFSTPDGEAEEELYSESISGDIPIQEFLPEGYDFIVGNTYTWKARSNFDWTLYLEDATEGWSDWSDEWSFKVVSSETKSTDPTENPDDKNSSGGKGQAPVALGGVIANTEYATIISELPEGEVLGEQDGADSTSSEDKETSGDTDNDSDDSTETEKTEKDTSDNKPFLFFGWWWLAIITVAGSAYILLRSSKRDI